MSVRGYGLYKTSKPKEKGIPELTDFKNLSLDDLLKVKRSYDSYKKRLSDRMSKSEAAKVEYSMFPGNNSTHWMPLPEFPKEVVYE